MKLYIILSSPYLYVTVQNKKQQWIQKYNKGKWLNSIYEVWPQWGKTFGCFDVQLHSFSQEYLWILFIRLGYHRLGYNYLSAFSTGLFHSHFDSVYTLLWQTGICFPHFHISASEDIVVNLDGLIDWLIDWCSTSSEQFFSYIQDEYI